MIGHFTSTVDTSVIMKDWFNMIGSKESQDFSIKYMTNVGGTTNDDPFNYPTDGTNEAVEVTVKGFIVNLKVAKVGTDFAEFVEAGDTVIFLYGTINLNEPEAGKPVLDKTLKIHDPANNRWVPNVRKSQSLSKNFAVFLGNAVQSTVLVCTKIEGV